MGYINTLRPDVKKVGWSIIMMPVWYFLGDLFRMRGTCRCMEGGFEGCIDYTLFFAIEPLGCHCSCTNLWQSLLSLLILLLPSIILYLTIAYFQYRNNRD